MTSQQSIDVYRFREIARSLFDGLNLSDNEILGRIEENRKDLYDYCLLINELEVLLGLKANFGITESKIELIINRVKEMGEQNQPVQVLHAPALEDPSYRVIGLEEMNNKVQQAFLFCDRIKALLFHEPTTQKDEDAIRKLEHILILYKNVVGFHDEIVDLIGDDFSDQGIVAEIKRLQQVEIAASQEPIATVVEMNYLRSKVVVLEKVIARLVGE